MENKKLFLVIVLAAILVLGTALVAGAADKIKVTGGFNNSFFGMGWEWMDVNVTLDPAAPLTKNAEGKLRYTVYTYGDNPKVWESWVGDPICGAFGFLNDTPTVSLVVQIIEVKNIPADWIGKYAKVTLTDGGQNASEDLLGIAVWDFYNNTPVELMPTCDFVEPEDILVQYPSQNGNLTIHE